MIFNQLTSLYFGNQLSSRKVIPCCINTESKAAICSNSYPQKDIFQKNKPISTLTFGNLIPSFIKKPPAAILEILPYVRTRGKLAGEGSSGAGYLITSPYKFFVKAPHTEPISSTGKNQFVNLDMTHEARILNTITEQTSSECKLLGFWPVGNEKFLIMSALDGSKMDPVINPLKPKHLNSLLSSLYEHDLARIYHSDINENNILVAKDKAHLFDYGDAFKFKLNNTNQMMAANGKKRFDPEWNIYSPSFCLLQNATNFESKALVQYLEKMALSKSNPSQMRAVLKKYIQFKAKHLAAYLDKLDEKLTPDLKTKLAKKIHYERLQASAFKQCPDMLVDLMALKTQTMYAFTKSNVEAKFYNRFQNSLERREFGISSAKRMVKLIKSQLNQCKGKDDIREFLEYELKFAKFLLDGAKVFKPVKKFSGNIDASVSQVIPDIAHIINNPR
ncbi:MAG: hypothetical protein A2Y25_11665 [Candidatus Melainabacteria bacterium GWF2_37_15]|nr:MAG: hypothetical protein A2Y25_11665 [Candidatus Melainabacteria bacterium GWF2_37_15]